MGAGFLHVKRHLAEGGAMQSGAIITVAPFLVIAVNFEYLCYLVVYFVSNFI